MSGRKIVNFSHYELASLLVLHRSNSIIHFWVSNYYCFVYSRPCHKFCTRCCRSCLVFFFLNAQEVSIDEETLFHQFIVLYLDLHSVKIWRIYLPPKNVFRKIIFKWFRLLKTTILTVTNVLTFDFAEFLCLFKVEIYQNYNSVFINIPTSITIVSEILTSSKLISRKIRGIEKF